MPPPPPPESVPTQSLPPNIRVQPAVRSTAEVATNTRKDVTTDDDPKPEHEETIDWPEALGALGLGEPTAPDLPGYGC